MCFQNEIIKHPYSSILLVYSALIITLCILSYFVHQMWKYQEKNHEYDSCNANNKVTLLSLQEIFVIQLFFLFFFNQLLL